MLSLKSITYINEKRVINVVAKMNRFTIYEETKLVKYEPKE